MSFHKWDPAACAAVLSLSKVEQSFNPGRAAVLSLHAVTATRYKSLSTAPGLSAGTCNEDSSMLPALCRCHWKPAIAAAFTVSPSGCIFAPAGPVLLLLLLLLPQASLPLLHAAATGCSCQTHIFDSLLGAPPVTLATRRAANSVFSSLSCSKQQKHSQTSAMNLPAGMSSSIMRQQLC